MYKNLYLDKFYIPSRIQILKMLILLITILFQEYYNDIRKVFYIKRSFESL